MVLPADRKHAAFNLADSPWFWVGLFALTALVALSIIGPKYIRRQQRLDQQHQARERAFRQQATQPSPPATAGQANQQPAADGLIDDTRAKMRFWTMFFLATVVVLVAWSVLAWKWHRRHES